MPHNRTVCQEDVSIARFRVQNVFPIRPTGPISKTWPHDYIINVFVPVARSTPRCGLLRPFPYLERFARHTQHSPSEQHTCLSLVQKTLTPLRSTPCQGVSELYEVWMVGAVVRRLVVVRGVRGSPMYDVSHRCLVS